MVTCNVSSSYTRRATDWGGSGRAVEAVVVAVLHPIVVQEFMLLVEGEDPISVIANRDVPLGI